MKKLIVLGLGIVLIAAACNKTTTENTTNPPVAGDETENTTPPPTPPTTPTPTPTPPVSSSPVNISIKSSGFSPASVTVKKGTTVNFVNDDTKAHWPASAPHPSHTDYSAFDPKQAIAPSDSWSFTFDKVGTWKYHDHFNPTQFGTVIVTE